MCVDVARKYLWMVFSRLQLGDMLLRPPPKVDKFLVVENVDKVWRRNSALG